VYNFADTHNEDGFIDEKTISKNVLLKSLSDQSGKVMNPDVPTIVGQRHVLRATSVQN
jgi:hypothetical protein